MGIALEELIQTLGQLIQRHGLYVATDLDYTYQHSPNCHNSGKSTIDLKTFCRINNLTVKKGKLAILKPGTRPMKLKENLSHKDRSHMPQNPGCQLG